MKKNIFRYKRRNIRNLRNNSDNSLQIKDVLIPILTAILVVLLQQMFFVENKFTEAVVDVRKTQLLKQLPLINRILTFTYAHEYIITDYTIIFYQDVITKEKGTNKIISRTTKKLNEQDSLRIIVPTFVLDTLKRNDLINDLEYINKNKELLEPEISYIFQKVYNFINTHKLPDISNKNDIISSRWKDEDVKKMWSDILSELRKSCDEYITNFSDY